MVSIDLGVPRHIAIIMDGNARWAKEKGLATGFGHKAGLEAIKSVTRAAFDLGVKYLTIYAFSTENWQRPREEINYLMGLLDDYLQKEVNVLVEAGVRIVVSGSMINIEPKLKAKIEKLEKQTAKNESICLNVAFDYGSRQEILMALGKIIIAIENKKLTIDAVDESLISSSLYHPEIPDPDLIIRTAGEKRLSNFMLWQAAYSELYFTKKYWPDFNREDLKQAILDFNKRERRYGKR